MKKLKKLWMVNMASCDDDQHGESLSGGERIAMESLKIWKKNFKKIVAISDRVWKDKSSRYLGEKTKLDYVFFEVPNIFYKNILVLFIYKIWKAYLLAKKIPLKTGDYIFSVSDIFPDTLTAYWLKKRMGQRVRWVAAFYFFAPKPFTSEFPYRGLVSRARGIIYWLTQRLCYRLIVKNADFVFSCNDIDREILENDGVDGNKIFSVYGGVDLKIPAQVPAQKQKYEAVFMARFHPQKGGAEAVKAWKEVVKRMPKAQLAMIGKGSEEMVIRDLIKKYNLEKNITILGFMDGVEKYKVLKSSRMFLHTAIYDTGGMAVAEGMAAGLPAVAFNQPGYKYIYPNGIIKEAEVGDVKKIASGVLELLDDEVKYRRLKSEAEELVKEWSWEKRSRKMFLEMTK